VSQLHARAIDRLRKILAADAAASLATRKAKPVAVARPVSKPAAPRKRRVTTIHRTAA